MIKVNISCIAARAGYGEKILSTLARQLTADYGRGFSARNLRHMLRFAQAFPGEAIVSALRRQLSWTHPETGEEHIRIVSACIKKCQQFWLDRKY